jgi:hypothetical protein
MLTLQWAWQGSEVDYHHVFSLRVPDAPDERVTTTMFMRVLAHYTLDELPDEALGEVLEFLGSAWAVHQPLAPPETSEPPRTRRGKITKRYVRPTYIIED